MLAQYPLTQQGLPGDVFPQGASKQRDEIDFDADVARQACGLDR
jgi:hypothetical protein